MGGPVSCGGCGKYILGTYKVCAGCGWMPEDMPKDMDRALAEAYPDRVPQYVRTRVWEAGKNSAARITELEKQLKEQFLMWHAADYQADQNWQLVKALSVENERLRGALSRIQDTAVSALRVLGDEP